jgi:hypothetical protein
MDDTPKNVTWKATLIGTAMTLASSTAGYISSHWGGQTLESAAKDKKELKAFIEESAKTTAATVEDSMRKYVDKKFETTPLYQPPKKRKAARE